MLLNRQIINNIHLLNFRYHLKIVILQNRPFLK